MFKLWHGDCLELMKDIPDGSVDLILTDPPYGTMKNAPSTWDSSKTAWDTTLDHDKLWREVNRVLRPNGACLLFSQEPYSTELITKGHKNVPFSYRMIWEKDTFANHLLAKTAPVCYFEEVLAFFKKHPKHDFKLEHPLRVWFLEKDEQAKLLGIKWADVLGNQMGSHYFTRGAQFCIPTEKNYEKLKATGLFDRDWQELKDVDTEYRGKLVADLLDKYPKVFNLPQGQKCKSNILKFARDKGGYHPTQKPVALLEDLIRTYSNEGNTVLDFTMGSGSTGVACAKTNRDFIGIELDRDYYDIAVNRINEAKETANGNISQE